MNEIVHIEFGVGDILLAMKFYTKVFSWKIKPADNIPDYAFIDFNSENSQLSGGMEVSDKRLKGETTFYVHVKEIDKAMQSVVKHGGKVILEKSLIPDSNGFIAKFEDPFGNIIGIWEQKQ